MFSLIFPGQGSQTVGMCKEFYNKFDLIKKIFKNADEILNFPISKLILEGPKEELDLTENTQPAIFLVGHSIFSLLTEKFELDATKATFFAGHSLGEYTALNCAGYINFEDTIKILKIRGKAMQSAVPKGEGGMIAVLGTKIDFIENLLKENLNNYECFIANDNSIAMDLIITVCANAAGEVCPVWPGKPSAAHWGVADPAAAVGSDSEKLRCFQDCFEQNLAMTMLRGRFSICDGNNKKT